MSRKAPTARAVLRPVTSQPKSVQTRERILDAAATVLSRKGYAGTRLLDVAEEADVKAPAIYYYFNSREELIEEVMWVGTARVREHVSEALARLPEGASKVDRIRAAVRAHLRFNLEVSDYASAAIRNAGQVPSSIRMRQQAEEARYGRVWNELFQSARDAGELRQDVDPYLCRMIVIGALNWAVEWWDPKTASIESVIEVAMKVMDSGIVAPRSA